MANDFKPTIGSKVLRSEAEKWIKKYDDEKRKEKKKDTKSVFFGKDVLEAMMKGNGAAGISFFFGTKYSAEAGKDVDTLVLIPTKEDGTLIWAKEVGGKDGEEEFAMDEGKRCPPDCPTGINP